MRYCPTIKYKPTIDIKAYNSVKNKEQIIPIVELFQIDKMNLEKIEEEKVFFLNALIEKSFNFDDAVNLYIDIKNTHPNIIPIIDDSFSFSSKKIAMKAMKKLLKEFDKIAFKINGIYNYYMSDTFENLILMVDDYENTTFILDIDSSYKYSIDEMFIKFCGAISALQIIDTDIKNFIISGSIIKVSSVGYEDFTGGCDTVENKLLKTFYLLESAYTDYLIRYSDYTIDEKHVFTGDNVIVTTFYPLIKFTNDDGGICVYKSTNRDMYDEYPVIANAIISTHPHYREDHCEGCEYIGIISRGDGSGKSTGNPSTWKTKMIIHHITVLSTILV